MLEKCFIINVFVVTLGLIQYSDYMNIVYCIVYSH